MEAIEYYKHQNGFRDTPNGFYTAEYDIIGAEKLKDKVYVAEIGFEDRNYKYDFEWTQILGGYATKKLQQKRYELSKP